MIPFSLHIVQKDGQHATEKIDHISVVMSSLSFTWSTDFLRYLCVIWQPLG